jgi:hypothetical protein
MNRIKRILLSISLGLAISSTAAAADFDGSRNLLEVSFPRFMHIEFKQKRLRGTVLGGEEQTTAIQNVQNLGGRTLLQGAENGRGWSMTIDQATGDMSAAIVGDDIGFILFGVCTVP